MKSTRFMLVLSIILLLVVIAGIKDHPFFTTRLSKITTERERRAYEKFVCSHPFRDQRAGCEDLSAEAPDGAMQQDFLMTMDPELRRVPYERLFALHERMAQLGEISVSDIYWQERGPVNVGGRTRAIMWDPNDPTQSKFWAGSVSGGLWYTNNLFDDPPNWEKVADFWDNIAISCIAYDPTNTMVFYVGTGEGWFNVDAVRGAGIWKTEDGGLTWNRLASTTTNNFRYVQKILVHPGTGDVYAATHYNGIMRSTDSGMNWVAVLNQTTAPQASLSNRCADLELTADQHILAAVGFGGPGAGEPAYDGIYISSTGNVGDWTKLNTGGNGFPTAATKIKRIELAVAPSDANVIYALVQDSTATIRGLYKSVDKGQNWQQITTPMKDATTVFTGNQAWYNLIATVHPLSPDTLFVGGKTLHRSFDGGTAWAKIEGIHADQHAIEFHPVAHPIVAFGNDGGVYITNDALGPTLPIQDKNYGYQVTQFYSCAMHPVSFVDYYLGWYPG